MPRDRWKAQEANRRPRSEWMIAPAGGRRDPIAMPFALVISAAVGAESTDRHTPHVGIEHDRAAHLAFRSGVRWCR
jgi:hypothetical protein